MRAKEGSSSLPSSKKGRREKVSSPHSSTEMQRDRDLRGIAAVIFLIFFFLFCFAGQPTMFFFFSFLNVLEMLSEIGIGPVMVLVTRSLEGSCFCGCCLRRSKQNINNICRANLVRVHIVILYGYEYNSGLQLQLQPLNSISITSCNYLSSFCTLCFLVGYTNLNLKLK
jgi:hypothetical protein